MALIDIATVKDQFPRWESFVRLSSAEDGATVDARLQREIDNGETELLEYVDVDETTITDQLTLHLLCIIKKRCFDVKHGDTAYDRDPQIVRDYKDCIAKLERYKTGEFDIPDPDDTETDVRMTAKPRRFGGHWFNQPDYETEDW